MKLTSILIFIRSGTKHFNMSIHYTLCSSRLQLFLICYISQYLLTKEYLICIQEKACRTCWRTIKFLSQGREIIIWGLYVFLFFVVIERTPMRKGSWTCYLLITLPVFILSFILWGFLLKLLFLGVAHILILLQDSSVCLFLPSKHIHIIDWFSLRYCVFLSQTIPGLCWELAQLQDTYILQGIISN